MSLGEYMQAMTSMITYAKDRNQGYPVVMPLIGTGASGAIQDKQEALKTIVQLLKARTSDIQTDYYIVIPPGEKDDVGIWGF